MKNHGILVLLSYLFGTLTLCSTFGQTNKTILYVEASVLRGAGKYNAIGLGGGAGARLHYPVLPNLALTAKVGVEYYKISFYGALGGIPTWATAIILTQDGGLIR